MFPKPPCWVPRWASSAFLRWVETLPGSLRGRQGRFFPGLGRGPGNRPGRPQVSLAPGCSARACSPLVLCLPLSTHTRLAFSENNPMASVMPRFHTTDTWANSGITLPSQSQSRIQGTEEGLSPGSMSVSRDPKVSRSFCPLNKRVESLHKEGGSRWRGLPWGPTTRALQGTSKCPCYLSLAARALLLITATVSLSFSGDETILPLPMFRGLHYPL